MTSLRWLAVLDVRSSTPARAKRLAPRPDGPLTHFVSPHGEKCRLRHVTGGTSEQSRLRLPARLHRFFLWGFYQLVYLIVQHWETIVGVVLVVLVVLV